jgi:hypothetical protein
LGIGNPDGLDTKELIINNINIAGSLGLNFKGLFAAGENDPCSASSYDIQDFIEVFYEVDATGEVLALCFNADIECSSPGDASNEPLHHDPDCDGDGGEGTVLTANFTEFNFPVPEGNSLNLRILIHMDSGYEEVAFDCFRVDAVYNPGTMYKFYNDDPDNGGILLAGPTYSFDPMTTSQTSPQTIWVSTCGQYCDSPVVPITITVDPIPVISCPPESPPSIEGCLVEDITLSSSLEFSASPIAITESDFIVEGGNVSPPGSASSISYFDNADISCSINLSRNFTIIDNCGIVTQCNQNFTIENSGSSITCPPDLTIECGSPLDPSLTGYPNVTNLCDPDPTISYSDNIIITSTCPIVSINERSWTVTESCGNMVGCLQTISLSDLSPPSIQCPPDLEIECGSLEDPSVTGNPIITDNCDLNPVSSYTDNVILTGSCPIIRIIERSWTASDDCGNISECLQIINVTNLIVPIITCPSDTIIEAGEPTDPVSTGNPGGITDCDPSPPINYSDTEILTGSCPIVKTIQRSFTATDQCGNVATCFQLLDISDTTPPVTVCNDFTVNIETPPGIYTLTQSDIALIGENTIDNFDPDPDMSVTPSIFDCSQSGQSIQVNLTATDDCGNASSCTAQVSVFNPDRFELSCPINSNLGTFSCLDLENIPALPTTQLEAESFPYNMVFGDNPCGAIVVYAVDDISEYNICTIGGQSITRTITVFDDLDNDSVLDNEEEFETCVFSFNINEDIEAPIINTLAQNEIVECDGSGNYGDYTNWLRNNGGASAIDNCGQVNWSLSFSGSEESCGTTWEEVVVFYASDNCGNVSSTEASFTVEDSSPPEIVCPEDITICADHNLMTATQVFWTPPIPNDICGNVALTSTHNSGYIFPIGTTTVSYTAIDDCGLRVICSFNIIVKPLPAVEIVESEISIYCQGNFKILRAQVASDIRAIGYNWSTGSSTDTIHVHESGHYFITVTGSNGCTREANYEISIDADELLSAYTIIAKKEVHLHGSNRILNGGAGVRSNQEKAKIHNRSFVVYPTTFVKADIVEINNGSAVSTVISGQVDVTLAPFLPNPFNSNKDVNIGNNQMQVLHGQIYGRISLGKNSTVIFTQSDIFIKEIYARNGATLKFAPCSFVRIKKGMSIDKNVRINPDNNKLLIYANNRITIDQGSEVNANIDNRNHNIKLTGNRTNNTKIKGQIIGNEVYGKNYVMWEWNTDCSPLCEPGPIPPDEPNFPGDGEYPEEDGDSNITRPSAGYDEKDTIESNFSLTHERTNGNIEEDIEVKVYPNPTANLFYLEVKSLNLLNCRINIFNANGELVLYKDLKFDAGINKKGIDTSNLPAGLYLIKLGNKVMKRLLIIK